MATMGRRRYSSARHSLHTNAHITRGVQLELSIRYGKEHNSAPHGEETVALTISLNIVVIL